VIFPETFSRTQKELFTLYLNSLPNDEQSYDKELCANFVYTRSGIISALNSSGRLACTPAQILDTYRFFLDKAFPLETDSSTRNRILTTGKNIITFQGKAHLNVLLPMLLEYLKKSDLPNLVYEQVIIYIGLLSKNFVSAQGMEKEMAIIKVIIDTTIEFDSQEIRVASSYALAEIISPFKVEGKKLVSEYFILLYGTDAQLSERKGYAYILAGLIKGVGIRMTLAEILPQLIANLDGKNGVDARLGAILLLEGLIGERLFEPYLLHLINPFLNCFADKEKTIVTNVTRVSKLLIRNISLSGLKIILPPILDAVADKNSAKKLGVTEMLGSLNHSQTNKLFNFLPLIVPKLASVLSDTSVKIQDAGKRALKNIGNIIKNPEIQKHVPLLLNSIDDPNKYSAVALEALLDTKFEHHIDAASLSLIMPMLKRSLMDRSTDTKSRATKIVANMSILADHKDLRSGAPSGPFLVSRTGDAG